MKILNVNMSLDPILGGGTAERTFQISRYLAKSDADVLPDKMRIISKAMGINLEEGLPIDQVGITVGNAINDLNKKIGIPTLKQLNIPEADLPAIAEEAMDDPLVNISPKKANVDDILQMLRKAYSD